MLKVGILGAGTMGKTHAVSYNSLPDVEIRGIVDTDEDAGQDLAGQYKAHSYKSIEELLEKEEVDIIDICLPTPFHKENVFKAAQASKDILCEKPIARNLKDAQEMVKRCAEKKVKFMIAQVLRFFPEYIAAKEIISSGKIGKPAVARTSRGASFPLGADDWYGDKDLSGGVILDMIIHDFDFLRWCFGEVKRVYTKSLLNKGLERIDYALVTLRFSSGVIAHVEGSWAYPQGTPFRQRLEVAGTKGLLEVDLGKSSPYTMYLKQEEGAKAGVVIPEVPLSEDPYTREIKHFVECVKSDTLPSILPEDGVRAVEIALAALESVKTGRAVEVEKGEVKS